MDDAHTVAVSDGIDDGANGVRSFLLTVALFLDNPVEELASRQQLKHQVDIVLLVEDLNQLDRIWVVKL